MKKDSPAPGFITIARFAGTLLQFGLVLFAASAQPPRREADADLAWPAKNRTMTPLKVVRIRFFGLLRPMV
jgi:hypothetical protein